MAFSLEKAASFPLTVACVSYQHRLPCTLQLEIELFKVSSIICEKHKVHSSLLVLEFWIVFSFFSQERLYGTKGADKLQQNFSAS